MSTIKIDANVIKEDRQNNKEREKQSRIPPSNTADGQRNRRMLANIQAALGGTGDLNRNRKTKVYNKNDEFAFNNIFEVLERIRLANTDAQVSLSDISKL